MKRKDRNKAPVWPAIDPDKYAAWIKHVFDRPASDPAWYSDADAVDFAATQEELVLLAGETFRRSGSDLAAFSDKQVSQGLWYIFSNAASNVVFAFMDDSVSISLRIQAVSYIKNLYRDCFAKRCTNTLSHIDEPGGGDLNIFCYMLWDESPLGGWKDAVFDVIEDALAIPHNACIESALHGLGHSHYQSPQQVEEIIDRFLARSPQLRPELLNYARAARTGCVQ